MKHTTPNTIVARLLLLAAIAATLLLVALPDERSGGLLRRVPLAACQPVHDQRYVLA